MSQKISQLPAVIAANIQDTDVLPLVATNITSKVTVANLRTKLGTNPPAGGRTVTDAFTYLTNNAVFNVKDFGAFGDGVTNDTTAFTSARAQQVAAGGGTIWVPKGTYLVSSIDASGTVPFVMKGEGQKSKIQTTAAANIAIALGVTTPGMEDFILADFWLNGTATNLGGIAFGSGTFHAGFGKVSNVRISGFTAVSAFGIALNTVQEIEFSNCRVQANYWNYYRPNSGFCTATSIVGFGGYIGLATHRGMNLIGSLTDLQIREQTIESNAKAGIYANVPAGSVIIIQDNYLEGNNLGGSPDNAVIELTGTSAAYGAIRAYIERNRWHDTARGLYLNYAQARVAKNNGLENAGSGWTTANANTTWLDNADQSAADFPAIYAALLGAVYAEDINPAGARFVYGSGARIHKTAETFEAAITMSGAVSMKPRGISTTTPAPALDTSTDVVSLADNAVADIGAQVSAGWLEIGETDTFGSGAYLWLRTTMAIIWQDAGAKFSIVKDTAGKINIYNETSRLKIQNKTGSAIGLRGVIRKVA